MAQHQWNRIQGCPPFGEHDRGTWWACLDCDDSLFVPEGEQQPELVNRTVCNEGDIRASL